MSMVVYHMVRLFALAFTLCWLSTCHAMSDGCGMRPTRLRVNDLENPLGVPVADVHFSWALEPTISPAVRNQIQSKYRIQCSSAGDGPVDIWDSGYVASGETLQIPYNGPKLVASRRVFWRVHVWSANDTLCEQSGHAWFETALETEADWAGAEWLSRFDGTANISDCDLFARSERTMSPRFRSEFVVPASIIRARAYIAGLGYYQMYIDNQRTGDSYLDPGWTVYSKSVLYSVYDVTDSLRTQTKSRHAVGVELGNGWWNPLPMKFWGHVDVRAALLEKLGRSAVEPMFRLRIVATLSDGSSKTLLESSHGVWRVAGSPTLFNNVYLGEVYDARQEALFDGWAGVGFNDSGWHQATVGDARGLGRLTPQTTPPVRRQGVLVAKILSTHKTVDNSTVVLDTGRNHAGTCRYRLSGKSGDVVSMRYGELLNEDGSLNVMTSVAGQIKAPNPKAPCQPALAYQADELILSGKSGGDDWTPSWSWHGFRYIEVVAPPGVAVEDGTVECYPMRSDVAVVANFSSSEPKLQKLRTLVRNTYDSNLMSVQSDCPHRERFGYGGDALGVGEAGLSIYDWGAFYAKRVRDFNDAQQLVDNGRGLEGFPETAPFVGIADAGLGVGTGPIGWETFQPVAQLWLYKYYGNKQIMSESFNSTYAYIKLLDSLPPGIEHGLGDWMPVEGTSTAFTGLGFQLISYLAFANITSILGMEELTQAYRQKAGDVAKVINSRFLDASTGAYAAHRKEFNTHAGAQHLQFLDSGPLKATQTGQGMALFTGIVPKGLREKALQVMVQDARNASFLPHACSGKSFPARCPTAQGGPGAHMTAGLFGVKWFLMSLADGGMNDLAYEVLTTETFPSLLWMTNNEFANATTIWESWFFSDNVFSHNHPMFGSSEVWLMQSVAGIQPHPAARGMHHVLIKPSPPSKLEAASASFDTPRGRIAVSWARTLMSTLVLNISIPPNVLATVHMPSCIGAALREQGHAISGGRRISAGGGRGAAVVIDVGSGDYKFETLLCSGMETKALHDEPDKQMWI